MNAAQIPPSTELHRYALELEEHLYHAATENPGLVGVWQFVSKVRERLENVRFLKAAVNLEPRRRIERASVTINMPRSTMYKFLKDMELTTDTFIGAEGDDGIIESSPVLMEQVRQLISYHRQYILGEPLKMIDEPAETKIDLPDYML